MTSEVETAPLNATRICHPVPVGWTVYSRKCNYLCLATGEPRSVPFHYVHPIRAFDWSVVHSVLRPFRLFLTSEDALQHTTNLISLSVLTKQVMIASLYKRSIRRSFMASLLIQHVMMICMVRVSCVTVELLTRREFLNSAWEVCDLRDVRRLLNRRMKYRIYRSFRLLYALCVIVLTSTLNSRVYFPHCCYILNLTRQTLSYYLLSYVSISRLM
jgi:hypothetical protein